jgi:hypothetical protein
MYNIDLTPIRYCHTNTNCAIVREYGVWLGWAYLTKKVPHAATTPIATAFKICASHRKNEPVNRLPTKVSFSIFD